MSMKARALGFLLFAVVVGSGTAVAPTSIAVSAKPIISAPQPPHDCLPCTAWCKRHPDAPQCN